MNATPEDARARVEQLIILTDRLTGLVAQQAKCFEARRPQDALAFGEEVGRLANLYRHESARVRGNPGLVSAAPLELRQRLRR
ncbi:MAG: flagellar basal body protein, partial [Proteobacteria bacterium]|nr:flagellar basal body protein [Pseudomonadota bacterium]